MVARKGQKHRVTNQTRRQVKNLTIVLTNKQEIKGSNNCVGEYENVCEIMKKKCL